MFIEIDESLEVTIYYKKNGRHYTAYSSKSFEEIGLPEEEIAKFSKLTLRLKPLTWGLYNDLQEAAMVKDNLGNRNWNYKVYKENKLRKIIIKWDATMKGEDDKMIPAPVNPQVISNLAPDIAEAILTAYDQITLIDEEEEKKS